jgi:hypothetical protein
LERRFGSYGPEASVTEVAKATLVKSALKKLKDLTPASAADAAFEKFMTVNNRCRDYRLNLQFSWEEELFGLLKQELDNFFHPNGELLDLDDDAVFKHGRPGPGASLGANGVDFYTKLFSSDLTATSYEVYYKYAAFCAADPNWRDAEFTRLTTFGLPSIRTESEITFVPKNRDTMRAICTEPNLNMFAQLGIGEILSGRLFSAFGIDLRRQPSNNVRLARLGSINGSISTIDLESASDSMALRMLDEVLPQWVLDTLMVYRCPATFCRGERVPLWMVSTMGNGYTFPLQTILFTCCVQAVAKQFVCPLGRADAPNAQWGVFGDDIILPSFMARRLCHLLDLLGFRVNGEKSYTDKYGTFRESCGGDFFQGHSVRGVYIKRLDTPQARYVAINRLNEWSALHSIPLRRTIGYLRDSVRIMAIPALAPYDAGIRVPVEALRSGFIHVYRSSKHRFSYLYFGYDPWVPSLSVLDDRIAIPRNLNRVPRRVYNPSGLMVSVLGGYVRDGKIPLALKQGENPRYRTKMSVTPFWGPDITQVDSHPLGFWERWKTAVLDNLGFEDPEA